MTKQANKPTNQKTTNKQLSNRFLVIKQKRIRVSGFRQGPELQINPAKLEAHTTTLFRTLISCITVLSSGLQRVCSGQQGLAPDQRAQSYEMHK